MARFTSRRERRLWGWAAAVLVAIYSSVGLAGTAAAALRERELLGIAFGIGFLVTIASVVGIARQNRPAAAEVWVAIGVAAAGGMIIVRMGIEPAERTHLFEYGLLAVLVHQALLERRHNGARVPRPGAVAVLITALLGWGDEALQAWLPNRVYELRDVAINALAAVVATTASTVLARAGRRGASR